MVVGVEHGGGVAGGFLIPNGTMGADREHAQLVRDWDGLVLRSRATVDGHLDAGRRDAQGCSGFATAS